jgi:hypothetical protein
VRRARSHAPGKGARGIGGLFPVAYMNIIEQEAAALGQSRSGFLTLLVKKQLGDVVVERAPTAPSYSVARAEMAETQHYVFWVARELAERIDDDRLRLGNLAANAYVIVLVNNWLGAPTGLPFKGSRSRTRG